ncbi:50S ribosomal protein L32 [Deferribacterales bacterium RsTz2092]|nr:50S ribosomal protein L32 [Deferribacterales bacterium]
MGNPKTKTTESKQGHRRSHHHPQGLSSGKCPNCGEVKLAHTVCPNCGHYAGKEVMRKAEL